MQIKLHILVALTLRLFLIIYGEWQDTYMLVKYTDVDYHVITDGAKFIHYGLSPFQRHTYRYTPLLAYLLLPNTCLFYAFGKLLFSAFDVLTGYFIYIAIRHNFPALTESQTLKYAALWLYNPLPILVSTRGNAESLLSVCVILTIYFIQTRRIYLSALMYGLAVHIKIYPIIYLFSLYLALSAHGNKPLSLIKLVHLLPNRKQIEFATFAFLSFCIPTLLSYALYNNEYISEAFLYHVTRKDIRHNFSPFFYLMYLTESENDPPLPLGLIAFFPQITLLFVISFKFACLSHLPLCLFLQTFVFVAYNKVCTSQYFLWYLCILPVVAPALKLTVKKSIFLLVLWLFGQAVWLLPAYLLEFQGQNTFLYIWLAGLLFFAINVGIVFSVIYNYRHFQRDRGHNKMQ